MRIAGKPLESKCHNETGNGMREGLKSFGIGQSAAKNGQAFHGTHSVPNVFTNSLIGLLIGSSSTGRDMFLEIKAQFGLIAFCDEIRKNFSDEIGRDAVAPNDNISSSAGRYDFRHKVFVGSFSGKFNRPFIAHRNFSDASILDPDRTSGRIKPLNTKTTLSVHQPGEVGFSDFIHENAPLKFNDYPEREYAQVSGSAWLPLSLYQIKEGDIVFSSLKDEAASEVVSDCDIGLTSQYENKPYLGDDYIAMAWPSTFRTLKNSIETLHQYSAPGLGLIMAGEIGRYENTRFVEQSNILKGVSNDGTAWSNGLSDWIYVFGEDTVMEGVVVPEEIRAKIPTDYGRSKGVAYYALMGWGLVQQAVADMRVVKWDSAA